MKNLNLFNVFIVGMALVVGSSGCHRKPSGLTPIPGQQPPSGETGGTTPGGQLPPETTPAPTDVTGGIPIALSDIFNHPYNEDREKFKEDTVYFDFDRATIKTLEESKLQDVANYFKGNTTQAIIVEGNCDERGTEKYNLSLGERRALAVREYLANLGMDPQRIKTVTFGASKPVDPGHSESAWKKNRRGDIILITPK